ncbi:hypothetical protein H6F46_01320 [Limnothrix sp. FACHB-1083]|uniref:hypothetical protein n=1 Tax=unclassified Limnothrix TaxID=2632864 RepID=UPI00167FEFC2|nr:MULTISPECIES: hypothetical protein [unclassified Limnothrix]MBD2159325.1 hypothetical protein [Limnothrix sp. FACHB-1083]MBD2193488.1 hypothetical protein [Limnothrix sp. FACHB-1088]
MLLDRPVLFTLLVVATLTIGVGAIGLFIGAIARLLGRRCLRKSLVAAYGSALAGGALGSLASLAVTFPVSLLTLGMAGAFAATPIGTLIVLYVTGKRRPRRRRAST